MSVKQFAGYNVYHAPDGEAMSFYGFAASREEALALITKGHCLPASLWDTARAAGHCDGLRAPDQTDEADEPSEWIGDDDCLVPVRLVPVILMDPQWEDLGDHPILTYTKCVYGEDGTVPGIVEVYLQVAEDGDTTNYRFVARDGGKYSIVHEGVPHSTEEAARRDARHYADDEDDPPDTDDLVEKILETGYFGPDATAKDILNVCEEAANHSQGCLLLPKGRICYPIGAAWGTDNSYLEDEHVRLPACYPRISHAADALYRLVKEFVS